MSGRAAAEPPYSLTREGICVDSSPILSQFRHSPSRLRYRNKSTHAWNPASYASYVYLLVFVSIEKINRTLETVFHWLSKHLEIRCASPVFSTLFSVHGVWIYPDETLSPLFDILHETLSLVCDILHQVCCKAWNVLQDGNWVTRILACVAGGISCAGAFVLVGKPWARVAKPWEDWWRVAASPLANSLAGTREGIWRLRRCSLLARSRIPPATQATWISAPLWSARSMGGNNVLFFETIKKETLTTEKEWVEVRQSKRFIFYQSLYLTYYLSNKLSNKLSALSRYLGLSMLKKTKLRRRVIR